MRSAIVLIMLAWLAGCAGEPPTSPFALSDGSSAFTFRCDDGWATCYAAASKTCGGLGYEEIDRARDESLSSAGRLHDRVFTDGGRENQVYSENVRSEVTDRVLTVRCKLP